MEKSNLFSNLNDLKKLNNNSLFVLICLTTIFSFTGVSAFGLNKETSKKDPAFEVSKDVGNSVTELAQQQKSVTGKVTDNTGASLPGVSVVVKGTSTGTVTDSNGVYSLSNISDKGVLQFSFVGMATQEILVGSKTSIDVVLAEQITGVDEVVVTGYGSQKKVDIIGAVGNVKAEKLEAIPATNLSETMAGRISGVYVDQTNGVPGIPSNLIIRSASSWNDSPPLYIIDGVVLDKYSFDRLSANEIENIAILKDI